MRAPLCTYVALLHCSIKIQFHDGRGDAGDQPEGGGREEPISEEVKQGRVEVDSSKNEREEGDGMIKSEGDAMEDDAATQSESDTTHQPEGEGEREEENPIVVSSEETTPQRK